MWDIIRDAINTVNYFKHPGNENYRGKSQKDSKELIRTTKRQMN